MSQEDLSSKKGQETEEIQFDSFDTSDSEAQRDWSLEKVLTSYE